MFPCIFPYLKWLAPSAADRGDIMEKYVQELRGRIKWLILIRLLVALPLIVAIVLFQIDHEISYKIKFSILLWSVFTLLLLSFLYAVALVRLKGRRGHVAISYLQIVIDTFLVSGIIYLTGGFYSFFQFLYFVIIIYTSMLLLKQGSLVMASVCSVEYGILIDLEYYGIIHPLGFEGELLAAEFVWSIVFYKILFTMICCFAVAILSSLLAIEIIKARKELHDMEDHIKRVEKMAAVGEMAAGLAHEIKNPLASLSGAIQLMKDDAHYHPDTNRLMKIALREADRLSALLNDFLMFARPKAGNPVPLRVDKALAEILDLFENEPGLKEKISLKRIFFPDAFIEIDQGHLHQVIWNLLMNAAQAIGHSGEITVKMEAVSSNELRIGVSDNGCGIAAENLKSIFDPFFTTKKKGVGLGLSIVHRLLESYGSRIDVESEVGQGTAFTLCFKRLHSIHGNKN